MSDHAAIQRRLAALEARCERLESAVYALCEAVEDAAGECDSRLDCTHCAAVTSAMGVRAELEKGTE